MVLVLVLVLVPCVLVLVLAPCVLVLVLGPCVLVLVLVLVPGVLETSLVDRIHTHYICYHSHSSEIVCIPHYHMRVSLLDNSLINQLVVSQVADWSTSHQ